MKTLDHSRSLSACLCAVELFLASATHTMADTHYVDLNSTNATPPYTNWSTAATNIQDAVDAAVAGDEIVVTNGVYATGGRAGNRVMVDKPLALRSVNGALFTVIQGQGVIPNYGGPIRCISLTNDASLSGFTLTNGTGVLGAGVASFSANAVVSNCVITGNHVATRAQVFVQGGGAYGVTLNNCTLSGNSASVLLLAWNGSPDPGEADGGGAAYCTMNNCTLSLNSANATNSGGEYILAQGGGAFNCTLRNCILSSNSVVASGAGYSSSVGYGGGASDCALNNCTVSANSGAHLGAYGLLNGFGVSACTLNNCTLTGSWTIGGWSGAYGCTLNNCISFDNGDGDSGSPGSLAGNNWIGDPLFVDTNGWADLRLQSNSPCINAGNNAYAPAGPDLDGNPRIVSGTVDIGAYEYQSLSLLNFSVVSNQAGFNITGQSNQVFVVEASTDLTNWSPLATNTLNGHPFPFTDPAPASLPQRFYRLQTQ